MAITITNQYIKILFNRISLIFTVNSILRNGCLILGDTLDFMESCKIWNNRISRQFLKIQKIILNKKYSKPNWITVKINENTVSMATRLWLQSKTSVKQYIKYILNDCLSNPLIQKSMLYQCIYKMVPESGVIFIADSVSGHHWSFFSEKISSYILHSNRKYKFFCFYLNFKWKFFGCRHQDLL